MKSKAFEAFNALPPTVVKGFPPSLDVLVVVDGKLVEGVPVDRCPGPAAAVDVPPNEKFEKTVFYIAQVYQFPTG